ncbi:hypothetical protein [Microbacterium sp. J1-1]|uniref:hypothetical protein n=1 Tax=Microbacterium sp. J1-1 TaxID=2992441 RepID=UPI0021152F8D|nr:hypothetical protein [Microbacterium sp. J1-1]UUE19321.1 hypothetical protein LRQ07_10920 [Microbacterium sp. J1-1]
MSGNAKDLLIRLLVDDDDLTKLDKAKESIEKDFAGAGVKAAGTGAAVALGVLTVGAIGAADAAADAEQSTQQLQFALDKFPATADTSAQALMDLNSQLALKTQFDDDQFASGQAVLAQYGLTGQQITELTPLLADYAAKTGKDIPTAAADLGKALLGQGRSLKDIGIDFVDTGSVGGNYGSIMEGLTSQVGGFAEAQGNTATGSSAIFKNSLGELMETLGAGLLPIMVDLAHTGVDVVAWMTENSGVVSGLATGVGILSGAVLLAVGAYKAMQIVQGISAMMTTFKAAQAASTGFTWAQTAAQWANNAAWLASPVTWIIIAIIVAIGLLVAAAIWLWNNWDAVIAWIGAAWSGFMSWITAGLNGFAAWWNGLWTAIGAFIAFVWNTYIVQPITNAINWVTTRIDGGMKLISAVWNATWNGLGAVVRNIWNGVLGWIEGGVNGAIDLINGMIRGVNSVAGAVGIKIDLIPHVNLPRLATGGVTTGPMMAIIGDNPGGREYVEPVDQVAARLERVALAAAAGSSPRATGPTRLHPDDMRDLARMFGEVVYPLIMKGAQKTVASALGG